MKTLLKEFIIGSIIILLFRIPIEIYYKKLDTASIFFGMFMILVWELTREYLNRPKKEPEPIITEGEKQISKLTENTILLSERLKEYKSKPIPEYAKGAKNVFIKEHEVGIYETDLTGKVILKNKETFTQESWSKQLNEYLKAKGLNDYQPFGFAPIEDKEPKIDLSKVYKVVENDNVFVVPNLKPADFIVKANGIPVDADIEKKGNTFTIKDKKPIAPPLGFNHDFHKQAIEAEKELDKVCKEKPKLKQGTSTCSHELVVTRISEYQTEKVIYSKTSCQKCGKEFE